MGGGVGGKWGWGYRGGGISGRLTDPLFVQSFKWADECAIGCLGQWVSMKKYSSDTLNKLCFDNFILIAL